MGYNVVLQPALQLAQSKCLRNLGISRVGNLSLTCGHGGYGLRLLAALGQAHHVQVQGRERRGGHHQLRLRRIVHCWFGQQPQYVAQPPHHKINPVHLIAVPLLRVRGGGGLGVVIGTAGSRRPLALGVRQPRSQRRVAALLQVQEQRKLQRVDGQAAAEPLALSIRGQCRFVDRQFQPAVVAHVVDQVEAFKVQPGNFTGHSSHICRPLAPHAKTERRVAALSFAVRIHQQLLNGLQLKLALGQRQQAILERLVAQHDVWPRLGLHHRRGVRSLPCARHWVSQRSTGKEKLPFATCFDAVAWAGGCCAAAFVPWCADARQHAEHDGNRVDWPGKPASLRGLAVDCPGALQQHAAGQPRLFRRVH
eukprot:m.312666 g.312666  ORF g.312666 m.312666 type:complete len:365 (+) comp23048_c0_seq36:3019-4113(+)